MKKLIQVVTLLCVICLQTSLHAQTSDTICVDKEQFKNVLKWSYYGLECDSIVEMYRYKDTLKSEIIEAQHEQITLDQVVIGEYVHKLHRLRLASFGLGGAVAILILVLTVK